MYIGLSKFVGTPAHRKSFLEGNTSLETAFGIHSKDFMTMILHIGMCMTSKLPRIPNSALSSEESSSINPTALMQSTLYSVVYMYMQLRRLTYVFNRYLTGI